jgi:hypothetical protein
MPHENLVTQTVVASIEATDDICKGFVPFAKRWVERPADFHFKPRRTHLQDRAPQEPIRR